MILLEVAKIPHVLEQLATVYEVHDEVDAVGPLEDILHAHNEWVVNLQHDKSLQVDTVHRILVDYHILSHAFKCVVLSSVRFVDEENFRKSTLADHGYHLKLLKCDSVPFQTLGVEHHGSPFVEVKEARLIQGIVLDKGVQVANGQVLGDETVLVDRVNILICLDDQYLGSAVVAVVGG